jgi:hypothetical protein
VSVELQSSARSPDKHVRIASENRANRSSQTGLIYLDKKGWFYADAFFDFDIHVAHASFYCPGVGIYQNEALGIPRLKVFPNPGVGLFSLEAYGLSGRNAELEIRDLHGSTLLSKMVVLRDGHFSDAQLDLSALPSAVYFLQISDKKTILTSRIIKL